MRAQITIALGLLLLGSNAAWGDKAIQDIVDQPVPLKSDGSQLQIDEIRESLIAGCKRRLWAPVRHSDNEIKCSILVRGRHYAEVLISFSEANYSIVYSDSRMLDYDEKRRRIHRNYNKWVANLAVAIRQQFGTI